MAKTTKKLIKKAAKFRYQYAAKFICTSDIPGTSQQSPGLLPGNYATAINIHNPSTRAVKFRSKVASPFGISKWVADGLKGAGVLQISCDDYNEKYDFRTRHGFEGFLVIESNYSLDVVAVYTATPLKGGVSSIDVEEVKERRLRKLRR